MNYKNLTFIMWFGRVIECEDENNIREILDRELAAAMRFYDKPKVKFLSELKKWLNQE